MEALKFHCMRACSVVFDPLQPYGLYVACQALLSMGFPRQEYWSGLPVPPPGESSYPGIESVSLVSPALAGTFFTTVPPGNFSVSLLFAGSLTLHAEW